ncbi:hypothetical protein VPH5P1C_0222 [Vibrio phage 5P1c]
MFCSHKRKLLVKKLYKGKIITLETGVVLNKYTYVKFCPDCNKNIYEKVIG